jgi:S-adenosylmethionine/arginine decarboxylase-like enzyme
MLIQHHHLLLRLELETCPQKNQKVEAEQLIQKIIRDLNMHLLAKPHVYYVTIPHYNEGLTAIAPIQTSHIAFHFWNTPDSNILHQETSRCLLEFDIYTCGNLTIRQIHTILHHLTKYKPTHVDINLLNRMVSLKMDRQMHWDRSHTLSWSKWLESSAFLD